MAGDRFGATRGFAAGTRRSCPSWFVSGSFALSTCVGVLLSRGEEEVDDEPLALDEEVVGKGALAR
jgi:hypothetical protein